MEVKSEVAWSGCRFAAVIHFGCQSIAKSLCANAKLSASFVHADRDVRFHQAFAGAALRQIYEPP